MLRVVCALIEKEGKVLVAQRGQQMNLPGKWEFPGGKVKVGETDAEALIREIQEELALEIDVLERLTPVLEKQPRLTLELHPYRCRLIRGTITLTEHQNFCWATAEELPGFDWCPADRPIVAEWLALPPF